MSNVYLEILNLKPGATKEEIKASYRNLSKKYHPDICNDEDANEKFIEINEAFKFLTDVGPKPDRDAITYNYDPSSDEYEQWRYSARTYAKKRAYEEARLQNITNKKIINVLNIALIFIAVFNIMLAIDYLLPRKSSYQKIENIDRGYEQYKGRKIYKHIDISFENIEMRFDIRSFPNLENYTDQVLIFATPIFNKPYAAEFNFNNQRVTYNQIYSVFIVFGYMIPGILLFTVLYFFILKTFDNKLSMALIQIVVFLIQISIFGLY